MKIKQPLTYDATRDLTIQMMEILVEHQGLDKTDQPEDVWYPFDLQDKFHTKLNEALGVKE